MRRRRPHRNTYSHDDISANVHGYSDPNLGGYRHAYDYICRLHPSMNGTITVTASGEASVTTSSPD